MDRNAEARTIIPVVYRDVASRDNSVQILERLEASVSARVKASIIGNGVDPSHGKIELIHDGSLPESAF